jgi:hypothetical protein
MFDEIFDALCLNVSERWMIAQRRLIAQTPVDRSRAG